jgi:predicted CXXCH cytochrome family protein
VSLGNLKDPSMRARLLRAVLALVAVAAIAGAWVYWRHKPVREDAGASIAGSDSPDLYADPATCAECHAAIAESYRKTGMGRSFYRLHPDNVVEDFTRKNTFKSKTSDSYFAMFSRDGRYFQRRWEIGFDGKETNVDEKQVDFVLGSGNHSRSYLHLTNRNTLQELPLGWYAEKGGYFAMNPGYDRPDYPGSVRPIYYECMFCHNGYPRIPEGESKDPAETIYLQPLPEGIDCQRCHGPGAQHVAKASVGAALADIRAAIVNPGRLNADRAMEVCLQCHLETSVRKLPHAIRRFDRGPFSYRPGEPLGDFSLAFRGPGLNETFEVAQGGYRFRESQCFLKSQGKLRCTTCHNPHDIPRGEAATAHYNAVCQGCHAEALQRMKATHASNGDCTGCHMPKRRTDDAVHMVMTDHRIMRTRPAGDLLADKAEVIETEANWYRGAVSLYYPPQLPAKPDNSIYTAIAQVRDQSNLSEGLPELKKLIEQNRPATTGFYGDLAQAYLASGDAQASIPYFQDIVSREPRSAFRLIQLSDAFADAKQWAQAEAESRKATELAPDSPLAWGRLGWALWQQDKAAEARVALEKAVALDPEIADLHNYLGLLLWGTGDQHGAEKEFREALRIQPGIAEWRLNLGRALATEGQVAEARFQMERSLKLKPDNVEAKVDYARLLGSLNHTREATAQAKEAVAANPRNPLGHEVLGVLLADANDVPGAIRELRSAVELQPDFGRAHYELGMVLGRKGETAAALEQLQLAAQGSDPQARGAAEQALQQLRR